MRLIESGEQARQHIEADLRGLAKSALERSHESKQRSETESDGTLRAVWQRVAEAELRIAKHINDECDALVKTLGSA